MLFLVLKILQGLLSGKYQVSAFWTYNKTLWAVEQLNRVAVINQNWVKNHAWACRRNIPVTYLFVASDYLLGQY